MKVPSFLGVGRRGKLLMTHRFVVTMGIAAMGFQSVTGIELTEEVTYINEGGNNAAPVMLKAPRTQPHFLTFKRGLVVTSLKSITAMMPGDVASFGSSGTPGTLIVLDEQQDIRNIYAFTSLGMVEWQLADLEAEKGGILVETMKIAHKGLTKITIPDF